MGKRRTVRVGCGSAYDGDRLDWSVDLARSGLVSYLGFDCLAEATMTFAQLRRVLDPSAGYAHNLEPVVRDFGGFVADGLKIVGNFGGSNTRAAVDTAVRLFREQGRRGVRVGGVHGDDIRDRAFGLDLELPDLGCRISQVKEPVVSVNVYSGAAEVMELLDRGADFVIGGRTADPSLYVAPICHELGWDLTDLQRVAEATTVGHLLECGILVSGGRLANAPHQLPADAVRIGMPYAEVGDDRIVISKTPESGGVVDERTVKLQLGYEIQDPANYLTPDVTLDVSRTAVAVVGENRVEVTGMTGKARPETLKVLVGLDLGWKVGAEMSFGGPGCLERAEYAKELLAARCAEFSAGIVDSRADLIGVDSLFGDRVAAGYPAEVRLRFAARCPDEDVARAYMFEAKHLSFSLAGATASTPSIERFIGVTRAYVPRSAVSLETELVTV
ncbi:acyclic terpene utilization AtuA family protein [Actinomadura rugatobispora]|uniref:Acyclic terpene utilization AtuA family protein n=1 Tax=Actinomadura rugatobispora TaxID=1994 RepID=A0ABW1A850_9ACTN|nr:DUF1446 domain-containing protein [Actinomadura rugatobispora]